MNDLVSRLRASGDDVGHPPAQLLRIAAPTSAGLVTIADGRPSTPLSEPALLTNTKGEPSLGSELRAEIDTADRVDLLCAFVKWHGLRLLEAELGRLQAPRSPFRVITTTYIGATERAALDRLVSDFGAEVKIQYDAQRTRLHAKAWLFRRHTGFDTAYVGSSNLSRAALLDGVEWNVRLSRVGTPSLLEKFAPPSTPTGTTRVRDATTPTATATGLTTRSPKRRDARSATGSPSRSPGWRSVRSPTSRRCSTPSRPSASSTAATATSSSPRPAPARRSSRLSTTGASAIRRQATGRRLLFVAHRREILEQSLRTYREVLADANFGELYVGGARPERWRHVFASVQSLTSYGVDEHPGRCLRRSSSSTSSTTPRPRPTAASSTISAPRAPRTDRHPGTGRRHRCPASFFDGRTAAELRLWDALGADLLCPFHYFAVADGTDLRRIAWSRGRYDEARLSNVYTGNDARAAHRPHPAPRQGARSRRDARPRLLRERRPRRVHGPRLQRGRHPGARGERRNPAGRAGEGARPISSPARVNVLFAVDLFNEGLDLPDVDTVLFLRPTESATIFLQQLGRGLRRTQTKAVLTVLDFVGYHRKEFRFDRSCVR